MTSETPIGRWLLAQHRWLTFALFIAGFLAALSDFISRNFISLINDEWAYLLQADTLLRGRLTLPSPTFPEFFEAPQILATPVYAAKYYPGEAVLLMPFLAAHVPWLLPCLCLGASAALLFRIGRRAGISPSGSALGSLTFLLLPATTSVLGTFLTHAVVTLLYVFFIYFFLEKPRRPPEWLVAGILVAICMLTRPLDSVALCAAAGLLALVQGPAPARERAARIVAIAIPCAAALLLMLLYNQHLTGNWRLSPWTLWAQQYTPFDGPGIGPPTLAAGLRPMPPQIELTAAIYRESRIHYLWPILARTALGRLIDWTECLPSPLYLPLVILGFAHLKAAPRVLWMLLLAFFLYLLQLSFHASAVQYMTEQLPALGLIVGLGIDALAERWRQIDRSPRRALVFVAVIGAFLLIATTYPIDIDLLPISYVGDIEPISVEIVLFFSLAALVLACTRLGSSPRIARLVFSSFLAAIFCLAPIDLIKVERRRWGPSDPALCLSSKLDSENCLLIREARYEAEEDKVRKLHGLLFVTPLFGKRYHQEYPLLNPGLGVDASIPLIRATDLGPRDAELRKLFPDRPAFLLDENLELHRLPDL